MRLMILLILCTFCALCFFCTGLLILYLFSHGINMYIYDQLYVKIRLLRAVDELPDESPEKISDETTDETPDKTPDKTPMSHLMG